MDIIDNVIYANLNSLLQPLIPPHLIQSDYIGAYAAVQQPVSTGTFPVFSYSLSDKMNYCSFEDPISIEKSVLRHWYDVANQVNYDSDVVRPFGNALPVGQSRYVSFENSSTYHLIYSYLLENTRILQIFERLIEKYLNDEEFGIVDDNRVFNWIQNSERLFFKNDSPRATNIRSLIRPNSDASRRNAYWRMFGMDLAFGDINSLNSGSSTYVKAKTSNQEFIVLFEKYLSEIWQAYINSRNTSGANTADINSVTDLARQLQELLIARRGNPASTYNNMNLSREEFSSVLMTSWFTFIISDDTPVVNFLNCQSSKIGERLLKIGTKVGIPAHSQCQSLFELAGPASTILVTIEAGGVLDDDPTMTGILTSLNPPPLVFPTPQQINYMNDFLTVINYWEKATGHRIKNPQANIRGTVTVAQPQKTNGKAVTPSYS